MKEGAGCATPDEGRWGIRCLRPSIGRRIIDVRGNHVVIAPVCLRTCQPSGDQNATIREQRCGVVEAFHKYGCRRRPPVGRRIIEFCTATHHKHLAVTQQSRGEADRRYRPRAGQKLRATRGGIVDCHQETIRRRTGSEQCCAHAGPHHQHAAVAQRRGSGRAGEPPARPAVVRKRSSNIGHARPGPEWRRTLTRRRRSSRLLRVEDLDVGRRPVTEDKIRPGRDEDPAILEGYRGLVQRAGH